MSQRRTALAAAAQQPVAVPVAVEAEGLPPHPSLLLLQLAGQLLSPSAVCKGFRLGSLLRPSPATGFQALEQTLG